MAKAATKANGALKKEAEKLREEIRRHEYLYYVSTSRKFPTRLSTS